MRKIRSMLLVMVAASLAVCGLAAAKKPKPPDARRVDASTNTGADSSGVGSANAADEEGAERRVRMAGMLAKRTIYFDFDSSEIRGEGTDIVAAHAKHLASTPAHEGAPRRAHGRARLA